MSDAGTIAAKYRVLAGRLDEATLRLWAAVEARSLGRGGVSLVAKAIGMSRTTIYAGLEELASASPPLASVLRASIGSPDKHRIRVKGGGRKKLTAKSLPQRRLGIPRFCVTLTRWLSRPREGTRSRRCGGPARARLGWPRSWPSKATKSASAASVIFWHNSTIACNRRARPA